MNPTFLDIFLLLAFIPVWVIICYLYEQYEVYIQPRNRMHRRHKRMHKQRRETLKKQQKQHEKLMKQLNRKYS